MTRLYLIKNDSLLAVIDSGVADVVALPLFRADDDMSLLNERHAINLMTNLSLTATQALVALGVSDQRASLISTVFVTTQIVSLETTVEGVAYKICDIGSYALYQVLSNQSNLLALHAELWALAPTLTLGMLAVVQTFGTSFYPSAMRTAVGMTVAQALARRDRIATYLESLGKDASALWAATNEHAQMSGIVTALGYTMTQLWAAMVA